MTSNRNHSCASFIFIPDTDRQTDGQTSTDKGADESTYKETHRVKSDKHMCMCVCVSMGDLMQMWGLGRKPGPLQPGPTSLTPSSVSAPSPPLSTIPDAKGYLLQPVPIHYAGPLNQQGHFWGVSLRWSPRGYRSTQYP